MSWWRWSGGGEGITPATCLSGQSILTELTGQCARPTPPPILDPDAEFNKFVKDLTIYVIVFLLLYTLAYVLIWSLLQRKEDDDTRTESPADRISIWVCAFSVAVALGGMIQVPLTIFSNETKILMHRFPSGAGWVEWLNYELVAGYWDCVFMLTNVSLFMLLPWAYFFREAATFLPLRFIRARRERSTAVGSGISRSVILLLLFWCLICGIVYLVLSLCGMLPENRFDIWGYLPYLNAFINFFGALILFRCVPGGAMKLASLSLRLRMDALFKSTIMQSLYAVRLERDTLRRKATGSDSSLEALHECERRVAELERQSRQSPIFWNTLSLMLVGGNAVLYITLITRLVMHCLSLFIGMVGYKEGKSQDLHEMSFGRFSVSMFGHAGAAVEVLVHEYVAATLSALLLTVCAQGSTSYYIAAGMVGFYSLEAMRSFSPRWRSWNRTELVVHSAFALMVSSALPVLAWSVGITDIIPMGVAGRLLWTSNAAVVLLYNLSFIFYSLISVWHSPIPGVLYSYWEWLRLKFVDTNTLDQQRAQILVHRSRSGGFDRTNSSPAKYNMTPLKSESDYWDATASNDALRNLAESGPSLATLLHAKKSLARGLRHQHSGIGSTDSIPGSPTRSAFTDLSKKSDTDQNHSHIPHVPLLYSASTPIVKLAPTRLTWNSPTPQNTPTTGSKSGGDADNGSPPNNNTESDNGTAVVKQRPVASPFWRSSRHGTPMQQQAIDTKSFIADDTQSPAIIMMKAVHQSDDKS